MIYIKSFSHSSFYHRTVVLQKQQISRKKYIVLVKAL